MNMEALGPVFKALTGDNYCLSWVMTPRHWWGWGWGQVIPSEPLIPGIYEPCSSLSCLDLQCWGRIPKVRAKCSVTLEL